MKKAMHIVVALTLVAIITLAAAAGAVTPQKVTIVMRDFSYTPAKVTLQAGVPAARVALAVHALPVGGAHVTATVTDAGGSPVESVAVTLRVKTTFGWLTVAEGRTDLRGQIHVVLPASSRFEEIAAEAGDGETVQTAVRLVQGQPVAPIVRPGYDALVRLSPQPGFISPYPVPLQVLLLTVILGGVWATYGYVVSLLAQIRRAR